MTGTEVLMRARLAELWRKMCAHEGIDPTEKFVVFHEHNPYASEYNDEATKLLAYLAERSRLKGPLLHWGEPRPAFE